MSSSFILNNSRLCYGCTACQTVCPVNAVKMLPDDDGFLYPVLDDSTCIHCGKCQKSCPALAENVTTPPLKVCGLIHRDEEIWKQSTSGGAFTAICQVFGDNDTIVFGVVYNPNTKRAEHTFVTGVEKASSFCGSKYVQSYLGDSFEKSKEFLAAGKKVIFTGTPCQISGLIKTLQGVNMERLLCIAVMCNGVASPSVLKQYILHHELQSGEKIIDCKFRDKRITMGIHNLYRRTFIYENKKKKSSRYDLYNNCYTKKILCRQSCFHCGYNFETIDSDLTIGDFKKIYQAVPNAAINKNGSVVVCHTSKGLSVLQRLSYVAKIYDISLADVDYPNSASGDIKKRNAFFEDFKKEPENIVNLLNKYSSKKTPVQKIGGVLPNKLRAFIKKKLRKCNE